MWAKRFDPQNDLDLEESSSAAGAFVAVPAMMGAHQQQLYHWAYEQAKQSAQISPPATMHDLFAVMN